MKTGIEPNEFVELTFLEDALVPSRDDARPRRLFMVHAGDVHRGVVTPKGESFYLYTVAGYTLKIKPEHAIEMEVIPL